MSTDYAKKKNAELEELLKARSLPHTGKKADLIARLQEDDAKQASSKTTSKSHHSAKAGNASSAAATNDDVDRSNDAATAKKPAQQLKASKPTSTKSATSSKPPTTDKPSTSSSATALAAGGLGPVSTPTAVPNQIASTDPAQTNDLTVLPTTTTNDPPPPPQPLTSSDPAPAEEFTSHLPPTSLTSELEKRSRRAARFGTLSFSSNAPPTNSSDPTATTQKETLQESDARRALERAKRFGTTPSAVTALDAALPDRGVKRKGEHDGDRRGAGKRGRSRPGVQKEPLEKQKEEEGPTAGNGGKTAAVAGAGAKAKEKSKSEKDKEALREKDRLAAEARRKRFAAKP